MESEDINGQGRHMNDSTLPPGAIPATMTNQVNDNDSNTKNKQNYQNVQTKEKSTSPITSNDRSRQARIFRVQKGFGLADWTRLVRSAKDLAQRHGQDVRRGITREEVALHKYEYDAWIILHNKVYNIGPYLPYHPGGISILKSSLGKDASALFDKYHRWVNVEGLIGSLLLGYLDLTPQSPGSANRSAGYLPMSHGMATAKTEDGFAIPAPRINSSSSLLTTTGYKEGEEDEDDDMDPLELIKSLK